MLKIFVLLFILGFLIFIISLCFASAKEEEFYNKLIIDKKIDSDKK